MIYSNLKHQSHLRLTNWGWSPFVLLELKNLGGPPEEILISSTGLDSLAFYWICYSFCLSSCRAFFCSIYSLVIVFPWRFLAFSSAYIFYSKSCWGLFSNWPTPPKVLLLLTFDVKTGVFFSPVLKLIILAASSSRFFLSAYLASFYYLDTAVDWKDPWANICYYSNCCFVFYKGATLLLTWVSPLVNIGTFLNPSLFGRSVEP